MSVANLQPTWFWVALTSIVWCSAIAGGIWVGMQQGDKKSYEPDPKPTPKKKPKKR